MPGGRNSGAVYNLYKVKYKKHKKNNSNSSLNGNNSSNSNGKQVPMTCSTPSTAIPLQLDLAKVNGTSRASSHPSNLPLEIAFPGDNKLLMVPSIKTSLPVTSTGNSSSLSSMCILKSALTSPYSVSNQFRGNNTTSIASSISPSNSIPTAGPFLTSHLQYRMMMNNSQEEDPEQQEERKLRLMINRSPVSSEHPEEEDNRHVNPVNGQ